MLRRSVFPVLLALTATACDRQRAPDPRPMVQKTLSDMLVYPYSTQVSMTAGADAAQITLTSVDSTALIAKWFRQALVVNGWALRSDVTGQDGAISILATKGDRPVWITLRPNVGGPGTTYSMIGALPTAADTVQRRDSVK
jgi:hypothetical protein